MAMSAEQSPNILQKGTPLSNDPSRLSILSYNLLAPIYVRPIDSRTGKVQEFAAFAWAEPAEEVLEWNMRMPKLVEELKTSQADVICLQEIQFEKNKNNDKFELPLYLQQLEGYDYRIGAESSLKEIADRNKRVLNNEVAVGNAILWKTNRLEPIINLNENSSSSIKDANTRVAMCFKGLQGGGLDHLDKISIISVHLDATSEEQRIKQLSKALEIGRHLGTRNIIIAGDMNTECLPGSCVVEMINNHNVVKGYVTMSEQQQDAPACEGGVGAEEQTIVKQDLFSTEEPTKEQIIEECISAYRLDKNEIVKDEMIQQWNLLRTQAKEIPMKYRIPNLKRVLTGETRAAHDHGTLSEGEEKPSFKSWKLDHILYNHDFLTCVERWSTLEHDLESSNIGLPNKKCPSDHLPIAAIFNINHCNKTSLNDDEINDLVNRWKLLLLQFQKEKDNMSQQYDNDLLILENEHLAKQQQQAEEEAGTSDTQGNTSEALSTTTTKKKKTKKVKPSDEMVLLLRRKREALKTLSQTQEQSRLNEVTLLNDLELDVAEKMELFGLKLPSSMMNNSKK
jgi:endonuclease/exonuclease/phosphatase family metal-dependent hydrolase